MRNFSVPADFKRATIDGYRELNQRFDNAKVAETYGQATVGGVFGSGRGWPSLPVIDLRGLEAYVDYSAAAGLGFSYTLNASCLGNSEFTEAGMRRINRFLRRLWNMGIASVTVTLPQLVPLVRRLRLPLPAQGIDHRPDQLRKQGGILQGAWVPPDCDRRRHHPRLPQDPPDQRGVRRGSRNDRQQHLPQELPVQDVSLQPRVARLGHPGRGRVLRLFLQHVLGLGLARSHQAELGQARRPGLL